MIQVFRESGELLTSFKADTLPRTVTELKAFITRENIIGHDQVTLINRYDQPISCDPVTDLKYAVIAQKPQTPIPYQPIPFYVRKPDKKGVKLLMSPYTMVSQLQKVIEAKMGVPLLSQEMFFAGERVEDETDTLRGIGVRAQKIVHVVDKRMVMVDLEDGFTVYMQTANLKATPTPLEVKGKTTLGEFKFKASETLGIPYQHTILAYCSQILQDTQASLFSLGFFNGTIVKVLDERQAVIEHYVPKDDDQFLKRKLKALESGDKMRAYQAPPSVLIRQADSVIIQEPRQDISILGGEVVVDKSYAESFRINQSYEETYNRAIMGRHRAQGLDTPPKEIPMKVNSYFLGNITESPTQPDQNLFSKETEKHSEFKTQEQNTATKQQTTAENSSQKLIDLLKPTITIQPPINKPFLQKLAETISNHPRTPRQIKRAQSMKQFHLKIQDLDCNIYQTIVSELDTIQQIKNKLQAEHLIVLGTEHDLLLDGKVLDDYLLAKDVFNDEQTILLFMMPKAL